MAVMAANITENLNSDEDDDRKHCQRKEKTKRNNSGSRALKRDIKIDVNWLQMILAWCKPPHQLLEVTPEKKMGNPIPKMDFPQVKTWERDRVTKTVKNRKNRNLL
jgi:hypothetical protein